MDVIDYLPEYIKDEIYKENENTGTEGIEEIRIRIGQQIELFPERKWFGKIITVNMMEEILNFLTDYSFYTYEEQMKNGYFTLEGGHRVGIAGSINDQGSIDINAINIRIARQFPGCSEKILEYMKNKNFIYNTLIISGPGVGKTTYLRDCVRILSGKFKIGVVDERSEIGASIFGVPQNDLGPASDVMDNCLKARGMKMLLRSMSPQIIAVDEIGDKQDYLAIEEIMNSGVKFIGTVHAGNISELKQKYYIWKLVEKKIVERLIFLQVRKDGERYFNVFDNIGNCIC